MTDSVISRRLVLVAAALVGAMIALAAVLAGPAESRSKTFVWRQHAYSNPSPAYKPRSLNFYVNPELTLNTRSLKWRRWGKSMAIGKGRVRAGDPDNGYLSGPVTIKLTKIRRNQCGDLTPVRAYHTAVISTGHVAGRVKIRNLLVC